MNQSYGREKDVALIRQGNRAAAVGRLMLGEIHDWNEFLQADQIDLSALTRRQLKSDRSDIKKHLIPELKMFCKKNFIGMTQKKLSEMYEDIKALRGLELPLSEFEQRFAPIREEVLNGNPYHLTVSVSLWGLQFKVPEEELSKDVMEAIDISANSQEELKIFERKNHTDHLRNRDEISSLVKKKYFASRSGVLACFNLLEAYLNGIAWDYLRKANVNLLSSSQRKLLEDTYSAKFREKLLRYPEIINGNSLWSNDDADVSNFLDIVKPFRDSIVHPSPFAAPEKFGGYDKLRLLYRIDNDTLLMAVWITIKIMLRIHRHVNQGSSIPKWLETLCAKMEIEDN